MTLVSPDDADAVGRSADPVLFAIYKVLDLDRKYYAQKCVEWIKVCDIMYMEFAACVNVYSTPLPFAVSDCPRSTGICATRAAQRPPRCRLPPPRPSAAPFAR